MSNFWLDAQGLAGFQEAGGPRSVSGEPFEETMITESDGAEMLPAVGWSGAEITNARKATN